MPLSSETLPDDDREARAAQSQQEQGQVSFSTTAACLDWPSLLAVVLLLFFSFLFFSFLFFSFLFFALLSLPYDDSKAEADQRSRNKTS